MDNIAVINGVAAMAYQGEMPWHRLGVPMPPRVDVAAALKAANLNWNVDPRKIYVERFEEYPVEIPNRRAVVRDIDNQVLGIVTDTYAPMQNEEAFGVLNTACEKFGVEIESAGALGIGERVWMLAKMPESIEPIPGDRVDGYFLVMTGHNGSIPLTARLTPIRVVCENTLNVAVRQDEALIRLEHIRSDVAQLKLVEELISKLVYALKVSGESFAELAAKKMSYEEVFCYVNEVVGIATEEQVNSAVYRLLEIPERKSQRIKRRDSILNLVWNGRGSDLTGARAPVGKEGNYEATAWAAYNAVAEYVDHVRVAEGKSEKTRMSANKSALFGPSARMKERALALAIAA
jgi:phage/plasmid-like protein (TIGR03299 family)